MSSRYKLLKIPKAAQPVSVDGHALHAAESQVADAHDRQKRRFIFVYSTGHQLAHLIPSDTIIKQLMTLISHCWTGSDGVIYRATFSRPTSISTNSGW